MGITLKQWEGSNISPADDGRVYRLSHVTDGIFGGMSITKSGSNGLVIPAAWGMLCGRLVVIDAETLLSPLSDNGTAKMELVLEVDLNNSTAPAHWIMRTEGEIVVREDINTGGSKYQTVVARYTVSETAIDDGSIYIIANNLVYGGLSFYGELINGFDAEINPNAGCIFEGEAHGQTLGIAAFTRDFSGYAYSCTVVVHGGSNGDISWPDKVKWDGTAPDFPAGTITEIILRTYDQGTTWLASVGGVFSVSA